MNDVTKTRMTGRAPRRTRLAALVLGGLLFAGASNPLGATGWPVYDFSGWLETYFGNFQEGAEFIETANRWKKTEEQFDQARVMFQALQGMINLPPGAPLTPVDKDYLVAETCGGGGGLSPGALFETFVFKSNVSIKAQQRQICANIRRMQNRKYNDSLEFLSTSVDEMRDTQMEILKLRRKNNNQGTVQAADSESLRFANDLSFKAQNWASLMRSYDNYIAVMQENQKVVAQAALKGSNKDQLISDLIKTAALKTALSVN